MKYLKSKIITVLLLSTHIVIGQNENVSNLREFEGIWLFIPPKWSIDTTFYAFDIIKESRRISIYFRKAKKTINILGPDIIGFAPQNREIKKLLDLVEVGKRLHFYTPNPNAPNDSIHYFQEASPSCLALFNGIAGEEEMAPPEKGEPNYFTFNFNGRENEYHVQIHHLPNRVVQALCKNKLEQEKVQGFLKVKYACIKNAKVYLSKSPNQPTKMYLLQNDPVEVVEERDDWLRIKYYPEKNGEWTGKTIEGWIKKSDVE